MPDHLMWWIIICLDIFLIGITKSGFGSGVGLMIVPIMAISMDHVPGRGSEAALGLLLPLLLVGDFVAVSQYFGLFFPRGLPKKEPALSSSPGTPDFGELSRTGEGWGEGSSRESCNPATNFNPSFFDPVMPVQRPPDELKVTTTGAESALAVMTAIMPDAPPSFIELLPANQARQVLWRLMPGTLVGVLLGALLLWVLHQQPALVGALIRIEIGLESVLLVSLHWWRLSRGVQQRLMPEPWRSWLTGGFSAISSSLAHAAGPIIAMYLLPLKFSRQLYVGTCAIYFFLLNTAKLPAYWASGQFAHAELSFTVRFLPLVLIGAVFGRWINKRMSDKLFTQIVYGVTFLLGWYILADGIQRLFA